MSIIYIAMICIECERVLMAIGMKPNWIKILILSLLVESEINVCPNSKSDRPK